MLNNESISGALAGVRSGGQALGGFFPCKAALCTRAGLALKCAAGRPQSAAGSRPTQAAVRWRDRGRAPHQDGPTPQPV